jgi:ketosteroid isomerase-like protein
MNTIATIESAIRQLHARYADAVWRKDYVAFANCFDEEAEWRISGMVLRGRPQITSTIEKLMSNFQRVLMSFGTPIVQVDQSGAVSSRTYSLEQYATGGGPGGCAIGTYFERFIERDGKLLFAWRLFQLEYMGPADLSGSFFPTPDYGAPPNMPALDAVPPNHSGLGS